MNIKRITIPIVALSTTLFSVGCNSTNQESTYSPVKEDIIITDTNTTNSKASFEGKFWDSYLSHNFFFAASTSYKLTPKEFIDYFSEDSSLETKHTDNEITITDPTNNITMIIPVTSSDENDLIKEPVKLIFNEEQVTVEYRYTDSTDPDILFNNFTVKLPSGETSDGNSKEEAFELARKQLRGEDSDTTNIDTSISVAEKYWNSNMVDCLFNIKLSDREETIQSITEKIKAFDSKGTFKVETKEVDGFNETTITETDTNIELAIFSEENIGYADLKITFKNENIIIEHSGESEDKYSVFRKYHVIVGDGEREETYDKVTAYETIKNCIKNKANLI